MYLVLLLFVFQFYVCETTEGCKCQQLKLQVDCEHPDLFCKWESNTCLLKPCIERTKEICVPYKLLTSLSQLLSCNWDKSASTSDDILVYTTAMRKYAQDLNDAKEKQLNGEEVTFPLRPILKQGYCVDSKAVGNGVKCEDIDLPVITMDESQWLKICLGFYCGMNPTTKRCIDYPSNCADASRESCNHMYQKTLGYTVGKCLFVNGTCKVQRFSMPPKCQNYITIETCGQLIFCKWKLGECLPLLCSDMTSDACNQLSIIDDTLGGQVCEMSRETFSCEPRNPRILNQQECLNRTFNAYAWNGNECINCSPGAAFKGSSHLLIGVIQMFVIIIIGFL